MARFRPLALVAAISAAVFLLPSGCGGSANVLNGGGGDDGAANGDGTVGSDGSSSGDAPSHDGAMSDGSSGSDSATGDSTASDASAGDSTSGDTGAADTGHVEACSPKTCSSLGAQCGSPSDGCGTTLACGTCPTGETCGGGGVAYQCACVPKSCIQQSFNCGQATDGCGTIISCGACPTGQICGLGGPNVCGTNVTCTNLCLQQQTCTGTATTSVTGTVYAPNGVDPLPNTLVYVPNSPVQPFTPGVQCGSCGSDVSGSPLVSATTAVDGTFTITNMPVGTNIPLVIQNGRWRRQFVIPNVAACVNTALPGTGVNQLRMPQTKAEGDIPLMAMVTGSVDALECVLRKVGIADSEFSDPSGTGRVQIYQGAGSPGAVHSASTPSETTLWGTQAAINQYDMTYFACQGQPNVQTAAQQQIVINYANAGGRLFTTHYSYVWLYNDAPFSGTANWNVDQGVIYSNDPTPGDIGILNTTFPRGNELAQWLQVVGASTTFGQIPIFVLRRDFDGVVAPSLLWMTTNDPTVGSNIPMHYTFDTPVGSPPANQCGRVLYNDYHVEDAVTSGTTFPAECTVATMTPQEKMLEFDIFDLGSCVTPPMCTARSCSQQNSTCGPVGDGCGNIIMCGTCPTGQTCIAGNCSTGGCVPKSCAQQGFNCGMASDGCGHVINCGTCTGVQTCGGGGMQNVCGGSN